MSEPYLAQIIWFAGNFAPRNWRLCNGDLLPINSNQSLFSLLGTTYGGDGRTDFALPDLRGRVPIGVGQSTANGGSNFALGQQGGSETVVLNSSEIPSHTHQLNAGSDVESNDPTDKVLGTTARTIYHSSANLVNMSAAAIANTGGQGHENRQPIQACNYIICVVGLFPPRN